MENKFEVGELVMHKASGKKAVIDKVLVECVEHDGMFHSPRKTCEKGFSGKYKVQTDFDKTVKVAENNLIPAK